MTHDVLERVDLVALHRRLQRVDRVDLGDHHACTLTTEALCTSFTDVAITQDDGEFAGDHDVGRTVDGIDQRVATTIKVVELALRDTVVHVDRWEQQLALLGHLVETLHAGGGLFSHALHGLGHRRPLGRLGLE